MGLCATMDPEAKASAQRDKKVEKLNQEHWKVEKSKIKLLLLGAGESGKSTIFKQMKIIYGNDYTPEELASNTLVVYQNILQNFRALMEACKERTPPEDAEAAEEFAKIPDDDDVVLDEETGSLLQKLWNDPGVQATWKERANYQIQDSLQYYMDRMDVIKSSSYIPEKQDVLRARVRTSGIVEETYRIEGVDFVMVDVGGQRNERKKWIHCFDQVTAVIFVAAISEYDEVLYEDSATPRMEEALVLFDEICNSKFFKKTSMILFLNKRDIFRKKLPTNPIRVMSPENKARWTDFQGPYATPEMEEGSKDFEVCYEAAKDYFLTKFLDCNKQGKQIYHHVTCATDTENVHVVFNSCKDIILKSNLSASGFLDP